MDIDDEQVRRLIAPLDPAAGEQPPQPGSDRYRTILETAMQTETDRATEPPAGAEATQEPARTRRRRRVALTGVAAALVLVLGVGALVLQTATAPSAEAVVSEGADALSDVRSLEAELTSTSPDRENTSTLRVDGSSFEITSEGTYADGHTEASTMTVVDGTSYETIDGQTSRTPIDPAGLPAPFGPSSRAVIAAAMTGATVTESGMRTFGSVEATRYDIELSERSIAALAALTPNELAWFELEYPDQVDSVSIWIGDDLVRQIEIAQNGVSTRATYSNFDGDIDITAPSGPFIEGE